jgi:HTH-type transcriptional regulator, repressor for puuD
MSSYVYYDYGLRITARSDAMTSHTDDCLLMHANETQAIDRGAGVKTTPLVGRWNCEHNAVTTGTTTFEPGKSIPLHYHNVEETVMVLEGAGRVIMGNDSFDVKVGDVTWVPAGVHHNFTNTGGGTMKIYWVYGGRDVTRTIVATGETFEHLSEADRRLATGS